MMTVKDYITVSRHQDDAKRTELTFVGDYYLTGDRGYRDEDGYLWFVGRSDDVITSAGFVYLLIVISKIILNKND